VVVGLRIPRSLKLQQLRLVGKNRLFNEKTATLTTTWTQKDKCYDYLFNLGVNTTTAASTAYNNNNNNNNLNYPRVIKVIGTGVFFKSVEVLTIN